MIIVFPKKKPQVSLYVGYLDADVLLTNFARDHLIWGSLILLLDFALHDFKERDDEAT